jgi:hypothetical protein
MRSFLALMVFAAILPFALSEESDLLTPLTRDATSASWSALGVPAFPGTAQTSASDVAGAKQAEQEIKKLIGELGNSDYKVRESATKRLTEIGFPALKALYPAEQQGDIETKTRATILVKTIRTANNLPTRVNGMEFELIADKEWTTSKTKAKYPIKIALHITNKSDSICRLYLDGAIRVVLKDNKNKEVVKYGGYERASAASPVSEPLEKDRDMTVPLKARLVPTMTGTTFIFMCSDVFTRTWESSALSKGTYYLAIVYTNHQQPANVKAGPPCWVGAAETLLVTISIN